MNVKILKFGIQYDQLLSVKNRKACRYLNKKLDRKKINLELQIVANKKNASGVPKGVVGRPTETFSPTKPLLWREKPGFILFTKLTKPYCSTWRKNLTILMVWSE